MTAPRGGLAALCVTETISWGLLYYSLPVAAPAIADSTGWPQTWVITALSAGLLVSAAAGIRVGKLLDRYGGRLIMTGGSVVGVAGLTCVAAAPNLATFVLAWFVVGVAQSCVLYQPAFALITRWYGEARVKPLTILTLAAGLASTIFAPLVAAAVETLGWRQSYLAMAAVLAVTTIPLHASFLTGRGGSAAGGDRAPVGEVRSVTRSARFVLLQAVMAVMTLTMFAVTINLIPLLVERGVSYSLAAVALGLVGAGQVVGRLGYALLPHHRGPGRKTMLIGLAATVTLAALALLPGPTWALIAAAVAAGAARGCLTLLQATAVADRWGTDNFATINGVFSAPMTAVGALAPATGSVLAAAFGSFPAMALLMSALTGASAVAARKT